MNQFKNTLILQDKWIPLSEVQTYFNYKPTQMAALLKNKILKVAKVGKRKFILKDSIYEFLESKVDNN